MARRFNLDKTGEKCVCRLTDNFISWSNLGHLSLRKQKPTTATIAHEKCVDANRVCLSYSGGIIQSPAHGYELLRRS